MEESKQVIGYRIRRQQQLPINHIKEQPSQLFFQPEHLTNAKLNQPEKNTLCLLQIQKLQDQRQDNLQNLLRLRDLVKQTLEMKQLSQSSEDLVPVMNNLVDESISKIAENERKSASKKYFELFLEICQRESTLSEIQKRLVKKSDVQDLQVLESQIDNPDYLLDCSMNQIVQQTINTTYSFIKYKQITQRMLTQHLYSFINITRRRSQINTPSNLNESSVQSANLKYNDEQLKDVNTSILTNRNTSSKTRDTSLPKQPYFQQIQTEIIKRQFHSINSNNTNNNDINNSINGVTSRNTHQQMKYDQHRIKLPNCFLNEGSLNPAQLSSRIRTHLLIERSNSIPSILNPPNRNKGSVSPFKGVNLEEKNEQKCHKNKNKNNNKLYNLSCLELTSPQGNNNINTYQLKQTLNYSKQTNFLKHQSNDQTQQQLERMYQNLLKANCLIQTSIKNYYEEISLKINKCAAFRQTITNKLQDNKQEKAIKKVTLKDQIIHKIKDRNNLQKITDTLNATRKQESTSNERNSSYPRLKSNAYPGLEFKRKGIKLTNVLFESLTQNEIFSKLSVSISPREQPHNRNSNSNKNNKVKQNITPCYQGKIMPFPQKITDRSFNLNRRSIDDKNISTILDNSFSWKKQSSDRRLQPLPFKPRLEYLKIGYLNKNDLSAGQLTPNKFVKNFDLPITFRAKQAQPYQFQCKKQQQASLLKYLSCSSMQVTQPCDKQEKYAKYPLELDYPAVTRQLSPFQNNDPQQEEGDNLKDYQFSKEKVNYQLSLRSSQ